LGIYREKIDIMAKILQIASGNAKKTQIMYQANLNHKVLQKYLAEMIQASLLKFEKTIECYVPTENGRAFLNVYNEYSQCNSAMKKWASDMMQKKAELEKISQFKTSTLNQTAMIKR
jgi:predicted transcriptional regulator